jgi:hypothetical protein
MTKTIRILLVLVVVVGFAVLAGQMTVLASPPPPIDVTGDPTTGTGPYQIGECVTGTVTSFKSGIKLNAALLDGWNSYPTDGLPPMPSYYWTLPGGPADIFSCVVNIKLFEADQVQKSLDPAKGTAEVCLATPSGKSGSIYFLDKFFNDKPVWEKVGGPFEGGTIGCVPALKSGVYAFYAPEPAGHVSTGPGTTTTVTYTQVGSVITPYYTTTINKAGPLVLGGCVTGNVKDIPTGDRLDASLVKSWGDLPNLPTGVGEFYRCVVDLKFYENGKMVNQLAAEKGYATICFAVPPQSNGTIYFLDKYFNAKAEWEQIAGPFQEGISCGPADKTGIYGMVDKK